MGRFTDLKPILMDWETFSSAQGVSINDTVNKALKGTVVQSDPPEHTRLREILVRPLSPARLENLRTRIVDVAEKLVEGLCAQGSFDAATELAEHLPLTVVSELVGLPHDGKAQMLSWAKASFNASAPLGCPMSNEALPLLREAMLFMNAPELPDRLRPESWAAELYRASLNGEITHQRFRTMLPAYVFPSLHTTILATSSLVWLFARHPEQWDALRARPALVARAINEALRLEGPVRHLKRATTREVEVGGVRIAQGTRVLLVVAAANRDERRYADPDRFDITRDNADHLAFGHARHACAGMGLARLQMTALLEALVERVKRIEVLREERAYSTLRGFAKLDVKVF